MLRHASAACHTCVDKGPLQMHAHYCRYWRVVVTRLQKLCAARSEGFSELVLLKFFSWEGLILVLFGCQAEGPLG